jgi:hypothetical protein
LLALLAGAWLRVSQLRSQMLVDDEWHAVRMLIRADMAGIAAHFGLADYCIPLTLYYRWLYERAALSEWSMHLPLLLAGLALPIVAPWLLRSTLALSTRAIWTGLLAVSPSLVYFSRTARPYAVLALLGVVAFVAFRNWRERRGDRRVWAGAYIVATVFGGWAHLLSLVFTLWPFAYHGLGDLRACFDPAKRAQALRSLRQLVILGLLVGVPLALALGPPLLNDWGAMAGKAGANSATLQSLYRTVLMQFGIADAWLCMPMVVLFALGAWRLWRRERALVAMLLSAAVVGGIVVCAVRPAWIQHAPVLVRYAAPVLPFLLLFVAEGIAGALASLRTPPVAAAVAASGLAVLFVSGPLPRWYHVPNQFMDHAIFQYDYDPAENPYATLLQLGPVSPFLRNLSQEPPGSLTLIETPARAYSNYMPDPWLQPIHRQNVKYALASPVCGIGEWDEYPYTATGDRFSRMGRLADILEGATWGADYLVMRMQPWTLPPGKDFPWPVAWPDMPACVAKVAARLGQPEYQDDSIVVFRLATRARKGPGGD